MGPGCGGGGGGRGGLRGVDRSAEVDDRPALEAVSDVLAQYPRVGRRQFRARDEAEVAGEAAADVLVRSQRLRLESAGGQDQHQSGVQRLVEGVVRGGPAQGGQRLLGLAAQQRRVGGQPGRLEEFPLHGRELDVFARGCRDPHRHLPTPLPQRQDELPGRRLGPSGGRRPLALPGQLTEAQQVDLVGRRLQEVAAGAAQQTPARGAGRQPRFEQPPQRAHVAPHHVQRTGGRPLGPQHVDDLGGRHGPAGVRQEQGEQGALLGEAGIELPLLPPHPYRPQHLEAHHITQRVVRRRARAGAGCQTAPA